MASESGPVATMSERHPPELVTQLLETMDQIIDPGLALQEAPDHAAAASQATELVMQYLSEHRYETSLTNLQKESAGTSPPPTLGNRLIGLIAGGMLLERQGPRLQTMMQGCESLLRIASQLDERSRQQPVPNAASTAAAEEGPEPSPSDADVRAESVQSVAMDIDGDLDGDIDGEPVDLATHSRAVSEHVPPAQPAPVVVPAQAPLEKATWPPPSALPAAEPIAAPSAPPPPPDPSMIQSSAGEWIPAGDGDDLYVLSPGEVQDIKPLPPRPVDPTDTELEPTKAGSKPDRANAKKRPPSEEPLQKVSDLSPRSSPAVVGDLPLPTGPKSKRARRGTAELTIPTAPASMRAASKAGPPPPPSAKLSAPGLEAGSSFEGVPSGPKADRVSKKGKATRLRVDQDSPSPDIRPRKSPGLADVLALMGQASIDASTSAAPQTSAALPEATLRLREEEERALRAKALASVREPPPAVEDSERRATSADVARTGSTGSHARGVEREEALRAQLRKKQLNGQNGTIDEELEEGQIPTPPPNVITLPSFATFAPMQHPLPPKPVRAAAPLRPAISATDPKQLQLARLRARAAAAEAAIAQAQKRSQAQKRLVESRLSDPSPSMQTASAPQQAVSAPMISFDDAKRHDRPVAADQDDFDSKELVESFKAAEVAIAQGASVQDAISGGLPSEVAEDFLSRLELDAGGAAESNDQAAGGQNGASGEEEEYEPAYEEDEPLKPSGSAPEAPRPATGSADFIAFTMDDEDEEDQLDEDMAESADGERQGGGGGDERGSRARSTSPAPSEASSVEFILEEGGKGGAVAGGMASASTVPATASTAPTTASTAAPTTASTLFGFVSEPQICKSGLDCYSPTCPYGHPSPVSTRSDTFVQQTKCPAGVECDNQHCLLSHPSPALMKTPRCRFWPNCLRADCRFYHPPNPDRQEPSAVLSSPASANSFKPPQTLPSQSYPASVANNSPATTSSRLNSLTTSSSASQASPTSIAVGSTARPGKDPLSSDLASLKWCGLAGQLQNSTRTSLLHLYSLPEGTQSRCYDLGRGLMDALNSVIGDDTTHATVVSAHCPVNHPTILHIANDASYSALDQRAGPLFSIWRQVQEHPATAPLAEKFRKMRIWQSMGQALSDKIAETRAAVASTPPELLTPKQVKAQRKLKKNALIMASHNSKVAEGEKQIELPLKLLGMLALPPSFHPPSQVS